MPRTGASTWQDQARSRSRDVSAPGRIRLEHLRFSIFAPMVAGMVRGSGLSVEVVLLLLQLASFWMTLFASWKLAERCYASREARAGAVACWRSG